MPIAGKRPPASWFCQYRVVTFKFIQKEDNPNTTHTSSDHVEQICSFKIILGGVASTRCSNTNWTWKKVSKKKWKKKIDKK